MTVREILVAVFACVAVLLIVHFVFPQQKKGIDSVASPSLWECEPGESENTRVCRRAIQVRDPRDGHLELQMQTVLLHNEKAAFLMYRQPLESLDKVDFGDGIRIIEQK